jgi:tetratricopeptide (TPR) repeat protein
VGDYKGALRELDEALKINPKHALTQSNLGLAKLASGDSAGGLDAYRQAVKIANSYLLDSQGQQRTDNLHVWQGIADSDLTNAQDALATMVEQRPELKAAAQPALDLLASARNVYQQQMAPANP